MQFPLLSIIIFLPLDAGIAILLMPAHRRDMIRWTALIASVLTLMLTLAMYANYAVDVGDYQFVEGPYPWLPQLGISYFLGVDGISTPMMLLGALVVAFGVADYFIWGDILQEAPPVWLVWGLLGLLVGFVLYGVATLRARVLPRWCGVAFVVALPIALVLSIPLSFASMFVVFGLIWLALGYALWTRRGAPPEQRPRRVR